MKAWSASPLPTLACVLLAAALPEVATGQTPALPRPGAPEAAAVVDGVLGAYGGVESIRAMTALRQEGMLVARNGGGHGTLVRVARCPEALSVLVEYPGRTEIRIIEPGQAWRGESVETLEAVVGPMSGAMALQAARVCLPQVLDAFRESAVVERVEDPYTLLSLSIAEGMVLRIFVSRDTHLPLRSESHLSIGPQTMVFASDYADYRLVDGVLFPFQEESFASGVHTASIQIETLETNPVGDRTLLPVPKRR